MPECPKCQNTEMEPGTMLHGTGPFGMSTSVLRIQIKKPAQDDPYHYIAYHIDGYRCPQCGYVEMVANRRT